MHFEISLHTTVKFRGEKSKLNDNYVLGCALHQEALIRSLHLNMQTKQMYLPSELQRRVSQEFMSQQLSDPSAPCFGFLASAEFGGGNWQEWETSGTSYQFFLPYHPANISTLSFPIITRWNNKATGIFIE